MESCSTDANGKMGGKICEAKDKEPRRAKVRRGSLRIL